MPLVAGSRVGPYEVTGPIGAGGMGVVYRARDTKLGRDVALKVLPESASSAERTARFQREAQVLASLNHPSIAAIYGFEESAGALVLELVEGPTLANLIAGHLSINDALAIATQIVDAVEYAHGLGIVHRDLKPANIKVRPDGTVKVLDFGLAKLLSGPSTASAAVAHDLANSPTLTSPATEVGTILGTAAYMSPEQAKGRPVDRRTDIWAFGCVLYEMITGRRTFAGDDVSDTLAAILRAEPDWNALPDATPSSVRRLLRRCLEKNLKQRLPDIGVARLEIAEAAAPENISIPQPVPRRVWSWERVALAVSAVSLAALAAVAVSHWREVPAATAIVRLQVPPPRGGTFATDGTFPETSPDGRLVAFRARRSKTRATIWIRSLDALDARELEGTDGVNVLAWSPDSLSLVFSADEKIKRINVAGGTPQTLADVPFPGGLAWIGDLIIVASPAAGGTVGLRRLPASGGPLTSVTELDAAQKQLGHYGPRFLPDGRRFLYTGVPDGNIYLGSLDSPHVTQLIANAASARYVAPGFLVFGRRGVLMAQRFDPSSGTLSGDAIQIADGLQTVGQNQLALFSVSPAGVLAYESIQDGSGTPVWVDRHGTNLGPVDRGITHAQFPRLSPDGRRLAVVIDGDIWVADLGGRPPIRLTFKGSETPTFAPLWTRDGQRLVYETANLDRSPGLQLLPADGSTATSTTASPGDHFHPQAWSADGRTIIAVRMPNTGGSPDIVSFAATADGKIQPIVETPADDGSFGTALSPDGRWLAYAANTTGEMEIWVRSYPGPGAPVRVSPAGGVEPVWARNGRELFYRLENRVMVVAVREGPGFQFAPPASLFEGDYVRGGQPPSYDVAPDGRFIAVSRPPGLALGTQPFTVVINLAAELDRQLGKP